MPFATCSINRWSVQRFTMSVWVRGVCANVFDSLEWKYRSTKGVFNGSTQSHFLRKIFPPTRQSDHIPQEEYIPDRKFMYICGLIWFLPSLPTTLKLHRARWCSFSSLLFHQKLLSALVGDSNTFLKINNLFTAERCLLVKTHVWAHTHTTHWKMWTLKFGEGIWNLKELTVLFHILEAS